MLVIESAAASCGIPNDSFGKNHSTLSRRLLHTGCKVLDDRPIWSVHLFGLSKIIKFASKFIGVHAFHNAISRSCVLSNKSAKAKMIKNSNASTWRQADRPTTSQSTRDKKEMERAKKKKMWVHLVCNWECRRRLRHPKLFIGKTISLDQSRPDMYNQERPSLQLCSWTLGLAESKAGAPRHAPVSDICVELYTHPRISQSDFPVTNFVAPKDKSTRMKNYNFAKTYHLC